VAGSSPGFDATAFRDAISSAMKMGASPIEGERATFHFPAQLVYNGSMDGDAVPFDPAATVVSSEPPAVQVDCAIEYFDAEAQPTAFGMMSPTRIAVTVLDVDYERVKECSYVVVGGDRYDYRRTEPPNGLFDVGVYTLHFLSQSET